MAKDLDDDKTVDLVGGEDHMHRVTAVVDQAIEDAHLAAEHKLVAVRAYVRDESKAEKLTKNAERQKKFLEKKKELGEVKAFVPATVAEEIKAAGDFNTWLVAQKTAPIERIVEVKKEVPAALTSDQVRLIDIGRGVESTTGWRRSMIRWLLK